MIPTLVTLFEVTRRHYDQVAAELTLRDWAPEPAGGHVCSCRLAASSAPLSRRSAMRARCRRCPRRLRGVRPRDARDAAASNGTQWGQGVQLVVLASPYRSLMEPLLEYIEQIQREDPTATSP